jgi:hypothetical protein
MAGNQEGPILIRLVVGLPVVSKVLDPQVGEQVEQLTQALESLRVMVSRSVGITGDDLLTYILDKMRSAGVVNCGGDNNDWKSCFEEVGTGEFAEFASSHLFSAFAVIGMKARGHIIVTPNPIPTIMLVTNAGFVLLAKDVNASECFAIINTPVVTRLVRTRPCEFAIEF